MEFKIIGSTPFEYKGNQWYVHTVEISHTGDKAFFPVVIFSPLEASSCKRLCWSKKLKKWFLFEN